MRVSTLSRNTMIDAWTALLNGGSIRIYDGTRPATPETAVSTQVLLAELTLNATAFAAASSASATANAITADSSANATGTASWARVLTSGATAVGDLTVTATGGGGDLTFPSTSIVATAQVSITSFTVSMDLEAA
jgi:uncharacterized glyoxalase superfamily protein PhnB